MRNLLPFVLLVFVACAHKDDSNDRTAAESARNLGKEVTALVESAKHPKQGEDPDSVYARVHKTVVPLRERLEKIRQRTNTNVTVKADAESEQKAIDERAKINAELDQLEAQLNSIDPQPAPAPTE